MFSRKIRELEPQDISAVESIFDLYWQGDYRKRLTERVKDFVEKTADMVAQGFKFWVAEENGEVVGVAASREAPERMRQYSDTARPVEFYVLAVRDKGKGIGSALRTRRIEEARKLGYTEAVFFSGDTHQDSWDFHDNSEFKRAGRATAPDGEAGYIWRLLL